MSKLPIGIVAPTPGSNESESGHIATYMIVSVLLQFHEEVHVFTRSTAVMEFDHPAVHLHTYSKPFAQSGWYLRLPGQVIYQLKYCVGIYSRRGTLKLVLFGGSGFLFPMAVSKALGIYVLYRIGGVIHYQESEKNQSVIRDYWSQFLATVQTSLYHLADNIIVISPSLADFAGMEQFHEKISVWCHYYFDLEEFAIETEFEDRDLVIGHVGIISRVKGSLNLIEAVQVLSQEVDAKLLVVGDGPQLETAKKRAQKDDFSVEFTERIPRDEVPEQMNRMRLLVLSSVSEGVPKVILESMACGTVPIATDVGGISDFINHGENGYIIDTSGPKEIAETINEALEADNLVQQSNQGRKFVENNFSYESSVREYYKMLSSETPFAVSMSNSSIESPLETA